MINLRRAGRDSGAGLQVTSYSTLAVLPGVALELPENARVATELAAVAPAVAPEPVLAAPTPVRRTLPPAGWYVDPSGRHGQRYWDGDAWTEHTS